MEINLCTAPSYTKYYGMCRLINCSMDILDYFAFLHGKCELHDYDRCHKKEQCIYQKTVNMLGQKRPRLVHSTIII